MLNYYNNQDSDLPGQTSEIEKKVSNEKENKPKEKEKIKTNVILFLGNLAPTIDNYEVFQLITTNGNFTVESMNIKRSQNAAFAYVKLGSKKEVEEAKKKLNLMDFKGRILKADAFQKAEKRNLQSANTCLYFKGFKAKSDFKTVMDMFSQFGEINEFKPKSDKENNFIGSGSISFNSEEHALNALNQLNGQEIDGKKIEVMKFSKESSGHKANNNFPVVLIKNIPPHMNKDDELKSFLQKLCEVNICTIFQEYHQDYQETNGIALLSSSEEVEKCIARSKDPENNILGLEIFQAPYNKRNCELLIMAKKLSLKSKYEGSNVVVKGLPKEIDEKQLLQLFSDYGKVKSVKIATEGVMRDTKDSKGNVIDKQYVYESKGFGYVLFLEPISAAKAIEAMNNKPFVYKNMSMNLKLEFFNYDRQHAPQTGAPKKGKNVR